MKFVNDLKKANKASIGADEVLQFKRNAAENVLPQIKIADLGNTKTSAKKLFYENIYKNASNALDTIDPNVTKLNHAMSTL